MKKFILTAILLLSMVWLASADVYVLYDKNTKEVKSVSEEDDAVVEEGWEKVVLPGDFESYPLLYKPEYYKMNGNKFVVNTKKISDEENAKEKKKNKDSEIQLIINKSYKTACEDLESGGMVFNEIKCSDF